MTQNKMMNQKHAQIPLSENFEITLIAAARSLNSDARV
jgi:hypothetical protein